jgi:hypothetical protein
MKDLKRMKPAHAVVALLAVPLLTAVPPCFGFSAIPMAR